MKRELAINEKMYIKNNYQIKSIRAMEKESGVSKHHIKKYMEESGFVVDKAPRTIRKNEYSIEEIDFIKNNYLHMTCKEIGQILGREESAIHTKMNRLGLRKNTKWNEKDLKKLYQYYPIYPNFYITNNIIKNHSKESIIMKASELKIKKNRKFHYTKNQLKEILINFAKEIDRTPTINDVHNNTEMPSVSTYSRYFGSYEKACLEANLEIKKCIFGEYTTRDIAKDGKTVCLSNSELLITNFLIDNKVRFEKEKLYSDILKQEVGLKRCDWYLTDYNVIVEYFGLWNKEFYKEKMEQKILLCQENNQKIIAITDKRLIEKKLIDIFKDYI